jgi:hypothetical protein
VLLPFLKANQVHRLLPRNEIPNKWLTATPRSNVIKGAGDTLVTSFMAKCDQVMLDEGCDRTTVMIVRKRHEGLFDAFQLV